MTLAVYRIAKRTHRDQAFAGIGGVHAHSRWTTRGRPVVFAAGSISLALLEFTVHYRRRDWIPASVLIEAAVPAKIAIEEIDRRKLPKDWRGEDAPAELRKLGDAWLDAGNAAVLRVPSAIVPEEHNYLLNPAHRDFPKITVRAPVDYIIDGRLIRTPR